MNKTITNVLLCGVVASTFILVNCQNDPAKRDLKAGVVTPAATDPSSKITAVNFPTCTPEFLTAYDLFSTAVTSSASLTNTKKEDVNATVRESLLQTRKEVTETGKTAVNELNNIKVDPSSDAIKNADGTKMTTGSVKGCFKSDDKKNPFTADKLWAEINRVDLRITALTGVQSGLGKAKEAEQKTAQGNPVYNFSAELNDVFGLPTAATNNYLVDGKFNDSATLINDQNDKAKAVCRVTLGGSKIDDTISSLVLMKNTKIKMNADKDIYELNFIGGSSSYQITCYLPSGIKFEDGLDQAVGQNLTLVKAAKKAASPADVKPAAPADSVLEIRKDAFNPESST